MTDETTQPDTTTSPNEPPVIAPAVEAATQAEGKASEAPATSDAETSVLGGDVEASKTEEVAADTPAGPPEKYELALEGVELDQAMVEEATPILQALNLDNDQANQLMPVAAKLVTQTQEKTLQALVDAGAQQRKDWFDAFVADPDIGGAKREETEHLAAKAMDALGFTKGHPFRTALTESGFGNHPDMIRTFRRLGEITGEDGGFIRSNDGVRQTVPLEKRLYPND